MNRWTQILSKIAAEIIEEARAQMRSNNTKYGNSVASGNLIDSFNAKVVPNIIEITYLEYGNFLDSGTKARTSTGGPGFFEEIKEWVQYKNIEAGAAWPIYKSILEKGTVAAPWIWRMEEFAIKQLDTTLVEEFGKIVAAEFGVKFEKVWKNK